MGNDPPPPPPPCTCKFVIDHHTWDYVPYSLRTVWEFFHVPQYKCKGCETVPTAYCLYPRRLERWTICRCHYKGSTFSSVVQGPGVLVWQEFQPVAFCTADWRLFNCTTPAVRRLCCKGIKYTCIMPAIVWATSPSKNSSNFIPSTQHSYMVLALPTKTW